MLDRRRRIPIYREGDGHGFFVYEFQGCHLHLAFPDYDAEQWKFADDFFFAKAEKEGALDAVPEGYEVSESKNGLPVLKRSNK